MPRKPPKNKHRWTKREISFIKKNFSRLTNRQLAQAIGVSLTLVRMQCYSMGLKRMELEYWTKAQVNYLVKHYKTIGDKELSEIFQKKWPKKKGWTLKHIEKKRKYLKLKRTKKQIKVIHQRNVDNGRFLLCPVKRWLVTGVAKEKEIRMWRNNNGRYTPRIKINGAFVHWARWAWKQKHGKIPKGKVVVFKDDDPTNISVDNLEIITRSEHARRNSKKGSTQLSDNYVAWTLSYKNPELRKEIKKHPRLIELKRKQLLLNRTINEQKISKTA